jgi:hypothetical protein
LEFSLGFWSINKNTGSIDGFELRLHRIRNRRSRFSHIGRGTISQKITALRLVELAWSRVVTRANA